MFLRCAGLMQRTHTFGSVTQSLPAADWATIPHIKEHSQSFHMTPQLKYLLLKEAQKIRSLPLNVEPLV